MRKGVITEWDPEIELYAGGFRATLTARLATGATHTVIPARVLCGMGIKPSRIEEVYVSNVGVVERLVGDVQITVAGSEASCPVVFGESGWTPLLGASALAALEVSEIKLDGKNILYRTPQGTLEVIAP